MTVRRLAVGDEGLAEAAVALFAEEAPTMPVDVSSFLSRAEAVLLVALDGDDGAVALATYESAGGEREARDSVMFTWPLRPGREAGLG